MSSMNNNNRNGRKRRPKPNNEKYINYKSFSPTSVMLTRRGETMFPPRLRVTGRVAMNIQNVFSGAANIYNYFTINNAIAVQGSQNVSGLAWLISGQQSNGTSYAPYNLGIVRSAKIEVYAKTSASPNAGTGALVTMYPLPPTISSSSVTLTQAEEMYGRSNILELPLGLDTVTRQKPLISKTYKIWELIGVSEETYMNDYFTYAFGYAGLLSNAGVQNVVIQSGTENASTDTSLQIRLNVIIDLEIELFSRNPLITSAPHA